MQKTSLPLLVILERDTKIPHGVGEGYSKYRLIRDYSFSDAKENIIKISSIVFSTFFFLSIIDWSGEDEHLIQCFIERFALSYMVVAPVAMYLNSTRTSELVKDELKKDSYKEGLILRIDENRLDKVHDLITEKFREKSRICLQGVRGYVQCYLFPKDSSLTKKM